MSLSARISTRLAALSSERRRPVRLPRGLASVTFDDFPRSAWAHGGPLLARRGVRASYYAAGGFCGRRVEGVEQFTRADLCEVKDAGHEIGCHSFSHRAAPSLSEPEFACDLDRNSAFLQAELGQAAGTFAWPYGAVCASAKREAGRRFGAARGVQGGINAGRMDPDQLSARPLEARSWSAAAIEAAVAAAKARRGWVVFFTHDVSETPTPFGCTPAMLGHLLETLARAELDIAPVAEALDRIEIARA